jgi:hypothetical protein
MMIHDMGWRGDLFVRAAGLALVALAVLALASLSRLCAGHRPQGVWDYLLAMGGFLSSSMGAAALATGRGLFAAVRVSRRWRRR